MADLLSWLRACHLRFLETDEKELETYRAYFGMVEDRVVMPCIIPRRESRYDYEEVRRVSEEVKSSVDTPENEFDRHCLELAFLTNPLLTKPEDDVWFAEQSETLRIQEERLAKIKQERDASRAERALDDIARCCDEERNLMEVIVGSVKALVSEGEISRTIKRSYGTWDMPLF